MACRRASLRALVGAALLLARAGVVGVEGAPVAAPPQAPPLWVATGQAPRDGFVQRCGESLCLDGRPYVAKGVNYFMWNGAGPFDNTSLAALHDDLAFISASGVNTVLINCESFSYANMTVFLDAALSHGVRTLAYGLPERGNRTLPDHPGLIGYDLCWECHVGSAADRARMRPALGAWLLDRFGGSAAAVASCAGVELNSSTWPPSAADPTDEELCAAGPDSRVALFRRFVNDFYDAGFTAKTNAMRATDPFHLYGFRNGFGGNGSPGVCPRLPLDLRTGLRATDYVAPEGYHLITSSDGIPIGLANATAIGVRGAFTYAYGDVGKPLLMFEFGYPLRDCPDPPTCAAARAQQARFWADVVDVTGRKNASGVFPWVFTEKAGLGNGSWGAVYNYAFNNTVVDSSGAAARDADVALCGGPAEARRYRLVVTADGTGREVSCADATPGSPVGLGSWRPANATDDAGRAVAGRGVIVTLCGPSSSSGAHAAAVYVLRDAVANVSFRCPAGTTSAADWAPVPSWPGGGGGKTPEPAAPAGVGADGRCVNVGRMGLCVANGTRLGLQIVANRYGGLRRECPHGAARVGSGAFRPQVLPVATETWAAYSRALAALSPAPQRSYTAGRVVVDPDEGAGRYVMWQSGFDAFGQRGAEAKPVGVETACTGQTSATPNPPCVGGLPAACGAAACPRLCLNAEPVALFTRAAGGGGVAGTWASQPVVAGDGSAASVAVTVPADASVLWLAAQVGNTGEAAWLPSSAPAGAVTLACNVDRGSVPCEGGVVAAPVPWLATARVGPFAVGVNVTGGATRVVLQMRVASRRAGERTVWFGPTMAVNVTRLASRSVEGQ